MDPGSANQRRSSKEREKSARVSSGFAAHHESGGSSVRDRQTPECAGDRVGACQGPASGWGRYKAPKGGNSQTGQPPAASCPTYHWKCARVGNSVPRGWHPSAEWVRAKGSESWAGRYAPSCIEFRDGIVVGSTRRLCDIDPVHGLRPRAGVQKIDDVSRVGVCAENGQILLYRRARNAAHDVDAEFQAPAVNVIGQRLESLPARRGWEPLRVRQEPPVGVHRRGAVDFALRIIPIVVHHDVLPAKRRQMLGHVISIGLHFLLIDVAAVAIVAVPPHGRRLRQMGFSGRIYGRAGRASRVAARFGFRNRKQQSDDGKNRCEFPEIFHGISTPLLDTTNVQSASLYIALTTF